MLGFGRKKDDDDDDKQEKADKEQISQAMRSMSDQIGQQAKEIKELEEKLAAAAKEATAGDRAEQVLAQAQSRLKSMQAEMDKMKAAAAKAASASTATAGSAVAGQIGVTKIGPKTSAPAATDAAPTPAAPAPTAPAPAPASGGLQLNATAFVRQTGGKNLRLRNGPGLDTNAFDGLAPGTSMTLLEGPIQKDNYPWYRIRTVDGREGWVAGTELVTTPE